MSIFEIQRSERTHCRELGSGRFYTGFFFIDDKEISVDLFAYDEPFRIPPDEPVHLQTQKCNCVSLYENVGGPAGRTNSGIDPQRVVYQQHIISNVAVIGSQPWAEKDSIRLVTFVVNHSDDLFRHKDKTTAIEHSDIGEAKFELFTIRVGEMNLRVAYSAEWSARTDHPTRVWPYITIEFDHGVALAEYLSHVMSVVQLLSLSLGAQLKPSKIQICKLSQDEMYAAIDRDEFEGFHSVEYIWPEFQIDQSDLWVGGSFLRAWDDAELAALQACLHFWIDRQPSWSDAYALMMGSLKMRREISSSRLLNACRWFERIPNAASNQAITDEHIGIISEHASAKAAELGYEELKSRVSGSLKAIANETHAERISRLTDSVRRRFGASILDENVSEHLKQALEFRGRVAHGHYNPSDKSEFQRFAKSIYAMEAVCFLLTLRDMPISNDGLVRVANSPLLRDYRHS